MFEDVPSKTNRYWAELNKRISKNYDSDHWLKLFGDDMQEARKEAVKALSKRREAIKEEEANGLVAGVNKVKSKKRTRVR